MKPYKLTIILILVFLVNIFIISAHSEENSEMVKMMEEQMDLSHEQAEKMMTQMMESKNNKIGITDTSGGNMMNHQMMDTMMASMTCPFCSWFGWIFMIFSTLLIIALTILIIVLTIWYTNKIKR